MSTFFTATATADLSLLLTTIRGHDDLAVTAARVERDVIRQFTTHESDPTGVDAWIATEAYLVPTLFADGGRDVVGLRGFNPDADLVADQGLKDALRDVIADVINWRLTGMSENPHHTSLTQAKGAIRTLRSDSVNRFPPYAWDAPLARWNVRPPVYTA
jgi:hypothetical protein